MRSSFALVAFALSAVACTPEGPRLPPAAERAAIRAYAVGPIDAWSFDAPGLPAIDVESGSIVLADRPEDPLVRSTLVVRWRGGAAPPRDLVVLAPSDAATILLDLEGAPLEAATRELAGTVATRVVEANARLSAQPLRALDRCLSEDAGSAFCGRIQRVTCPGARLVIEDDVVTWRIDRVEGRVRAGWAVPPAIVGEGPPHRMIPCPREVFVDRASRTVVARVETVCENGGGDACILPASWKVLPLR